MPDSDSRELPFTPAAEIGHNGGPALTDLTGLVSFYDIYCPARFPSLKKRRSKQGVIKRLGLPVVTVGHNTLIDVAMGDDRLRELAEKPPQQEPQRRGPGRPRTPI